MQLIVGRIGRAQGIRGEVTVEVRTDDPDSRFAPGQVLLTDPAARRSAHRWARLAGRATGWSSGSSNVPDRDAAEALRGVMLLVDVDDDDDSRGPDEFYDHQLVGLEAVTRRRRARSARCTEVLHLPAQDLLAVRRADGTEVLVPFVSEIVPEVDLDGRAVTVDPPGGLLGRLSRTA